MGQIEFLVFSCGETILPLYVCFILRDNFPFRRLFMSFEIKGQNSLSKIVSPYPVFGEFVGIDFWVLILFYFSHNLLDLLRYFWY